MNTETRNLIRNALWRNNPALVQILGLCPLLAVSGSVINGLGLGLATIFVLSFSNTLVSATRRWLRPEIRIPVFVLVIASAVTVAQSLVQAFAYSLYQSLGIYLPLIVTNCAIIARAEAYAVKHSIHLAALDGVFMGVGFTAVIITLGAIRELLAHGTLFSGADMLFGTAARSWEIQVVPIENGITLAALPAGAFLCYGLLIAAKNAIDVFRMRKYKRATEPDFRAPGTTRLHNNQT